MSLSQTTNFFIFSLCPVEGVREQLGGCLAASQGQPTTTYHCLCNAIRTSSIASL